MRGVAGPRSCGTMPSSAGCAVPWRTPWPTPPGWPRPPGGSGIRSRPGLWARPCSACPAPCRAADGCPPRPKPTSACWRTPVSRSPSVPADPRVTVVIITRNRRAELDRTLRLLARLPEHPAIIVVDNGSDDGTAALVRWHHPDVQLIAARGNLGAVGRNLALRRITTPYVAFCDDDTWWEPGALTLAADALDAHPDVASVTARIVVEPDGTDDPITPELAGSPIPGRPGLPGPALLSIMAGASVLRADAFRAVGGFSPRLWLGGEEELLCADLVSRGFWLC